MAPNHTAYSKLYPVNSNKRRGQESNLCLPGSEPGATTSSCRLGKKSHRAIGERTDWRASNALQLNVASNRVPSISSSGGWARTITRLLNREPPYRLGHTGLFTVVIGWLGLFRCLVSLKPSRQCQPTRVKARHDLIVKHLECTMHSGAPSRN